MRDWSPRERIRFTRPAQRRLGQVCYAFDLLSLERTDVRDLPSLERRKLPSKLPKNAPDFAGRVGTSFSERALATLYDGMQKIKRATCPFVNLPEKRRERFGQGITPAMMRRCTWVEPLLVAQIKFTEWTLDEQLRQPVFLGLRTDKKPNEVVRE